MATSAPSASASSNTGASGPTRTGWGRGPAEPGAAFRGIGRGGARARGGRGGHRGGRPSISRGGAPAEADSSKKSPQDQAKAKAPSISPKVPAPPSISPSNSAQAAGSTKASSRPRPARKASESKPGRKPSIALDPSAPAPNSSSSPAQVSPRTPSRRKRSTTTPKPQQPFAPAPAPTLPRKPSPTVERSNPRPNGDKPSAASIAPSKDLPPHLVPHSATAPTFDIRHDIDALVERVRAVAMDRPHTPGSHIDWAGEDDDSLPDLDDWGVTSSTTEITTDSSKGSVISPILQDTLKPLPGIIDIDIPTPSIKLHEVNGTAASLGIVPNVEAVGEKTPRTDNGGNTPSRAVIPDAKQEAASSAEKSTSQTDVVEPPTVLVSPPASLPLHPSLPAKPLFAGRQAADRAPERPASAQPSVASTESSGAPPVFSPTAVPPQSSDLFSNESSPSPDRALSASIHAVSKSLSPPHHFSSPPPSFSHGSFNPSHARAHTMGRYKPDNLSDSDRPRRGDQLAHGHGRNHSTPPAGAGGTHAHSRTTSRPVITGDAISRLARSLGGTPLAKAAVPAKAN